MKRMRRNHGAAFKTQVVFAAGQGEKTLAESAPQFGVPLTQTTEWKPQLLVLSCVRRRARALRRASLDGRRETNTDLIPAERNTNKLGKIIGCVQ